MLPWLILSSLVLLLHLSTGVAHLPNMSKQLQRTSAWKTKMLSAEDVNGERQVATSEFLSRELFTAFDKTTTAFSIVRARDDATS